MDPSRRKEMLELFKTLSKELQQTYQFSESELISAIKPAEHLIPATAFATELTPFETIVRYLSEQHNTHEIARIVKRAPSVIERTLTHSKAKVSEKLDPTYTEYYIPATTFADKTYSFSEHLCVYLKTEYKLTNAQIAHLVGLDTRTVWTLLSRASKRGGRK